MIRTIIVDDEILSRIGIQSFIDGKDDISVSGVFENAPDAIDYMKENPVDIVITDIEMAEMNGLDFIKVIREENLAEGVIILSCHDDFSYAQEAIANGTDCYLLKHSVTEEKLIQEIKRIYEKAAKQSRRVIPGNKTAQKQETLDENAVYVLGVVRFQGRDSVEISPQNMTEGTMLVHLIEDIVDRGKMGTLFSPYDKDTFIVFRFQKNCDGKEIREKLYANISVINKNIDQYFNGKVIYGISSVFGELKQMRSMYQEAEEALKQSFYDSEQTVFAYRACEEQIGMPVFTTEHFLNQEGMDVFEKELNGYLGKAQFYRAEVHKLKDALTHACLMLMYQLMKENHLEEVMTRQNNPEVELIAAISETVNARQLQEQILRNMENFRRNVLARLENDELSEAFTYIEKNIQEKITLTGLADICCMSVPTFSKKFKERTGVTLVQYLNEKRIEKAKILLKNQKYSLWQIAEQTGFSNTNYLVRVFKKVTDQTVSDYRRQYGIYESYDLE